LPRAPWIVPRGRIDADHFDVARVPPRRSRMSFVTAPGPHPRSILRRPGPMTAPRSNRLTSVKKDAGEGFEGKALVVSLAVNRHPTSAGRTFKYIHDRGWFARFAASMGI